MPDLVVFLRGAGDREGRVRTLQALQRTTPDLEIRAVENSAARELPRPAVGRPMCLLSSSDSGALADHVAWRAILGAPDADVVLIDVGAIVDENWLDVLHADVYADAVNATASAVPLDLLMLDEAAPERLPRAALGKRGVATPAPLPGCVYVRRDALNAAVTVRAASERVLGPLEVVAAIPGLIHVLSRIVITPPQRTTRPSRAMLTPPVRRMLAEMEAAVAPLRVTLDLRCCAAPMSGTQVHALNLAKSLAGRSDVRLSVRLPRAPHRSAKPYLSDLPASVARHGPDEPIRPEPHVFHRPYQLLSEDEIAVVLSSGARLVVTHQDLILDRTPAYFASAESWQGYVRTTALTFAAADEVVFFSHHARNQAVADGLLRESKTSVITPGVDHDKNEFDQAVPTRLPSEVATGSTPFLLSLGNAFAHKNRLFALRVAEALIEQHQWNGAVVFAGGRPLHGASADLEAKLVDDSVLSSRFFDLGPVSAAERRWLYENAALVLFPTLYEGFGLVPFEAAAVGTPCVYSDRSSVGEYLPAEGAQLDLGDPTATAGRLRTLLDNPQSGARIVDAIRSAGEPLTWSSAAARYVDVYRRVMERPAGLSLAIGQRIAIASTAAIAANETERHVLVAIRVRPIRGLARAVFSLVALARRAARR